MEEFSRTELLFGAEAMQKLAQARVAVFGLGGVGSFAVEALARSGVGELFLIDGDVYSVTNLNRQLYAVKETIGRAKAEVAAERVSALSPICRARPVRSFIRPENAETFPFEQFDYVVDAIDDIKGKLAVIGRAHALNVPVISCMSAGNKVDPTAFRVADLFETKVCPIARIMRRELRKMNIDRLKVVYSEEEPLPHKGGTESERALPASNAFTPSAAGLILAGEAIKDIIQWRT